MNTEVNCEPNVTQAVPFLSVMDIEVSVAYYVDGLGFTMIHKWIDGGKLRWCQLQLGGAALMLQEFWKEGTHANLLRGKLGEGVAIYFICDDALAIYREVIARGIVAQEPFVGNATWVTGLRDPDGYALFFESPTDVPEETTHLGWEGKAAGAAPRPV